MTSEEIISEFKKLQPKQRVETLNAILRSIRDELPNKGDIKERMASAAKKLFPDYSTDSELTIFTSLDGEDWENEKDAIYDDWKSLYHVRTK